MAGKKATTPVQEDVKQETPVQEVETVETPQVEEQAEVQEDVKQEKVYRFTSTNPYLTVGNLGIQFREGKAQTSNLEVAKALAKVGGVELVED